MSSHSSDSPIDPSIPEKPSIEGLESRWDEVWENGDVFRFDRTKSRAEIFSIDSPPPL